MTAEETVANPAAGMAAKTAVPSIIPADDERAWRRWIFAAAVVLLVHAAIVFWILYVRDLRPAGVQPEAIMIELAPVDVSPDEASAVVAPGPQMQQAAPEEIQQSPEIPMPELPTLPKPNVVLLPPHKPKPIEKPKPKPKKIEKEIPKPMAKPVHQPPAPRTSAPMSQAAARGAHPSAGKTAGRGSRPSSGGGGAHSNWAPRLSISRAYPEAARARGEQGTVRVMITFGRNGHAISARLSGSSGSAILDQAALASARSASLPPLPPERGSSITVTVPIRYSINR
ncbi:MAG: energy transducer TonB [Methylocella sp.]